MIAYRAETAMVNILRDFVSNKDEARSLVRQIFSKNSVNPPYYVFNKLRYYEKGGNKIKV